MTPAAEYKKTDEAQPDVKEEDKEEDEEEEEDKAEEAEKSPGCYDVQTSEKSLFCPLCLSLSV